MWFKKLYGVCDKITIILLCVLMADCCITGAGRVVMLGPISLRMIIFGLTIIMSLPLIFANIQRLFTIPAFCTVCVFVIWIVIETVIGIANGNELSLLLADLKGFAYFALAPVVICVLYSKERVHLLMRAMMYACGMAGIIVMIHFVLYLWFPEYFLPLYYWGLGTQFSAIAPISDTTPRLFFRSSAYFLVGCAFPTYCQVVSEKFRLRYCVITGISLLCLLMTYTRSIYLGVIVAALSLVVGFHLLIDKGMAKRLWIQIGVSAVVMCFILSAFSIVTKTEYVGFALFRTSLSFQKESTVENPESATELTEPQTELTEPQTELTEPQTELTESSDASVHKAQQDTLASDQLRVQMQNDLLNMIKQSPIYGHGLGAALEWRANNEYFFLDITVKMGIIGLLLYLSPMLMMLWQIITERYNTSIVLTTWLCVLFGFMAFSYFNPYMNAALGVLYYCCTIGVSSAIKKKPNTLHNKKIDEGESL